MTGTLTTPIDTPESQADTAVGATCPHCRQVFDPSVDRSQRPRHQGAKCPHCRLFVPARLLGTAPIDGALSARPVRITRDS